MKLKSGYCLLCKQKEQVITATNLQLFVKYIVNIYFGSNRFKVNAFNINLGNRSLCVACACNVETTFKFRKTFENNLKKKKKLKTGCFICGFDGLEVVNTRSNPNNFLENVKMLMETVKIQSSSSNMSKDVCFVCVLEVQNFCKMNDILRNEMEELFESKTTNAALKNFARSSKRRKSESWSETEDNSIKVFKDSCNINCQTVKDLMKEKTLKVAKNVLKDQKIFSSLPYVNIIRLDNEYIKLQKTGKKTKIDINENKNNKSSTSVESFISDESNFARVANVKKPKDSIKIKLRSSSKKNLKNRQRVCRSCNETFSSYNKHKKHLLWHISQVNLKVRLSRSKIKDNEINIKEEIDSDVEIIEDDKSSDTDVHSSKSHAKTKDSQEKVVIDEELNESVILEETDVIAKSEEDENTELVETDDKTKSNDGKKDNKQQDKDATLTEIDDESKSEDEKDNKQQDKDATLAEIDDESKSEDEKDNKQQDKDAKLKETDDESKSEDEKDNEQQDKVAKLVETDVITKSKDDEKEISDSLEKLNDTCSDDNLTQNDITQIEVNIPLEKDDEKSSDQEDPKKDGDQQSSEMDVSPEQCEELLIIDETGQIEDNIIILPEEEKEEIEENTQKKDKDEISQNKEINNKMNLDDNEDLDLATTSLENRLRMILGDEISNEATSTQNNDEWDIACSENPLFNKTILKRNSHNFSFESPSKKVRFSVENDLFGSESSELGENNDDKCEEGSQ